MPTLHEFAPRSWSLTAGTATFALWLPLGAVAQDPILPLSPAAASASWHLRPPVIDAIDGELRVLAEGYKCIASANGVAFSPYRGPDRPSVAVVLQLQGARRGGAELSLRAAAPEWIDGGCRFDHGAVEERWLWRDRCVEQQFVVARAEGLGELRVSLAVRTELAARDAEGGVQFCERGEPVVHYGDVTVVDADGRRIQTATELRGDTLELVVPASFADVATWPLLIDPIVQGIAIEDDPALDDFNPEIAFDATNQTHLLVFERRFSSTDTDILARRCGRDGGPIGLVVALETGTREAHNPAVGAHPRNGTFLVAWDEDRPFDRVVVARQVLGGSGVTGSVVVVRDAAGETNGNPSVGGVDADGADNRLLLVVSEQGTGSMSYDVVQCNGLSVTQPSHLGVRSNTQQRRPRVSRMRGTDEPWLCVSERAGNVFVETVLTTGLGPSPVHLVTPEFDRQPVVAGRDGEFLVAWIRENPSSGVGRLAGRTVGITASAPDVGAIILDLRSSEPGGSTARDQSIPALVTDGIRYTAAYRETQANGIQQPFLAVFGIDGNQVAFHDGHVALATQNRPHGAIALASEGEAGLVSTRSLAVFDVATTSSDHDVHLVAFDGHQGGTQFQTVATFCAGAAAGQLTVTGTTLLGDRVTVLFQPTGIPLWLLGLPGPVVPLCGVSCRTPIATLLALVPGNALVIDIPTTAATVGASVAVQGASLATITGCTSSPLGFPFELTNALILTVR